MRFSLQNIGAFGNGEYYLRSVSVAEIYQLQVIFRRIVGDWIHPGFYVQDGGVWMGRQPVYPDGEGDWNQIKLRAAVRQMTHNRLAQELMPQGFGAPVVHQLVAVI